MDNFRISKKAIKSWMEDYPAVILGDRQHSLTPCNSSAKPYDGIYSWQLNKIMLQAAIKELPPILKRIALARWIKPVGLSQTLHQLGLSKDEYYKRCDWVIDYIYCCINDDVKGKARLLKKLNHKPQTTKGQNLQEV